MDLITVTATAEAVQATADAVDKGGNILKRAVKWGMKELQKYEVRDGGAFLKYLEESKRKYEMIKTILMPQPQKLYDFYVSNPLLLNQNKITTDDVNNVLDISNNILILGSGAAGKSTLMKHFFINEITKDDLVPIFIELKDINSFNGSFIEFIYSCVERYGFNADVEIFKYALEKCSFLFLFDAYDEIISTKADLIYKEIDLLCDKYPYNYYIITSRKCRDFTSWQRFVELETSPFSKEKAKELITKIKYNEEVQQKFINQLETGLYEKHKTFLSNPLLLSMMLLTYDNYAEIPLKLYKFYSNAFDTLYNRHDATKGAFKREVSSGLEEDDFRQVLNYFCFYTYLEEKIIFTRDEIRQQLSSIKDKHFKNKTFNIDNYIEDLIVAVCIVYKEGLYYKFTHRSFQEYFTAVLINSKDDEVQKNIYIRLHEKQKIKRDDNIIQMLFEMNKNRFDKNFSIPILKDLIKLYSNTENPEFERLNNLYEKICFNVEINNSMYDLCEKNIENVLHDLSNISLAYSVQITKTNENKLYWINIEYIFYKNYISYHTLMEKKEIDFIKICYEMCTKHEIDEDEIKRYYITIETLNKNPVLKELISKDTHRVEWFKTLLDKLEKETEKITMEFDDIL